jgi:hypothetical protein
LVVSQTAVEYRTSGVLTTAYYGEVISPNDPVTAQRLVEEGSIVPVEGSGT